MNKKNISATVDPEIAEFVKRDDVNTSGLVNKLLKQHMSGDTGREQMLRLRIDQVQDDINELENRLESKHSELARLEEQLDDIEEENNNIIQQAAEALSPRDMREKGRKVQFWMEETGLEYPELADALDEEWST